MSRAIRLQQRDPRTRGTPRSSASRSPVMPRRRFASPRYAWASVCVSASPAKRIMLVAMQRISKALPRSRAATNAATSRRKRQHGPVRGGLGAWIDPNEPAACRAMEATASALQRWKCRRETPLRRASSALVAVRLKSASKIARRRFTVRASSPASASLTICSSAPTGTDIAARAPGFLARCNSRSTCRSIGDTAMTTQYAAFIAPSSGNYKTYRAFGGVPL